MKYDEAYDEKLDEEFSPTKRPEGEWLDPWGTVLGKAYLHLFNTVINAMDLIRDDHPLAADLLLQHGTLTVERMLTECNHPLDVYIESSGLPCRPE